MPRRRETRLEIRGGNRPLAIGDDQKLCQEQRARPTAPNRGWCTPTTVVYTPTCRCLGATNTKSAQICVCVFVCTSCVRYRDLREWHISRMENARGGGGGGGGRGTLGERTRSRFLYESLARSYESPLSWHSLVNKPNVTASRGSLIFISVTRLTEKVRVLRRGFAS